MWAHHSHVGTSKALPTISDTRSSIFLVSPPDRHSLNAEHNLFGSQHDVTPVHHLAMDTEYPFFETLHDATPNHDPPLDTEFPLVEFQHDLTPHYNPPISLLQGNPFESFYEDDPILSMVAFSPTATHQHYQATFIDILNRLPPDSISMLPKLYGKFPAFGLVFGTNALHAVQPFIFSLRNVLPSPIQASLGKQDVDTVIFNTAVFQLVNRLVSTDKDEPNYWQRNTRISPVQAVISYLQEANSRTVNHFFSCIRAPYAQALAQNTLDCALDAGADRVVNAIFKGPLDPCKDINGHQSAAIFGILDIDVIKRVIRSLSNRSLENTFADDGQLHDEINRVLPLMTGGRTVSELFEIFEFALQAGFHPEHLRIAGFDPVFEGFIGGMRTGNLELIDHVFKSISKYRDTHLLGWVRHVFNDTSPYFNTTDEQFLAGLLKTILRYFPRNELCQPELMFLNMTLSKVLERALECGLSNIVHILEGFEIYRMTDCLMASVRGKNISMIHRLLDIGADPDSTIKPHRGYADVPCEYQYESPHVYTHRLLNTRASANTAIKLHPAEGPYEINDEHPTPSCDHRNCACVPQLRCLTPFSEALSSGYQEAVDVFKERGFPRLVHHSQGTLYTLISASRTGDTCLVNECLDKCYFPEEQPCGPECQGVDHSGPLFVRLALADSLFHAVKFRYEGIVSKLLERGAPVRYETLEQVIRRRNLSQARKLIQYFEVWNRDILRCLRYPNLGAPTDKHCIEQAVLWGKSSLVLDLIGPPIGASLQGALFAAIKAGKLDMVETLLGAGAQMNVLVWNESSLDIAAGTKDVGFVKRILRLGADPNNARAIELAIASRNLDMINVLLEAYSKRYPIKIGTYDSRAINAAIRVGDTEILRIVVTYCNIYCISYKNTYATQTTPLGEAILSDNTSSLQIMRMMLDLKADPDSIAHVNELGSAGIYRGNDSMGAINTVFLGTATALSLAIATNNDRSLDKVKLLIQHGADLNLSLPVGVRWTPLQVACQQGNYELTRYLINEGADVNAPAFPVRGATALQLAAIGGFCGILELLLDNGADLHAPPASREGRTPFEGATEHGRLDMMVLLLKYGADIVSDGGRQYRRAVMFAEKNNQMPAKDLADELYQIARGES